HPEHAARDAHLARARRFAAIDARPFLPRAGVKHGRAPRAQRERDVHPSLRSDVLGGEKERALDDAFQRDRLERERRVNGRLGARLAPLAVGVAREANAQAAWTVLRWNDSKR